MSVQTIRRRVNEFELYVRIAQKIPLGSDKNVKKRHQFAKEHIHKDPNLCQMIVWSYEFKFNVFGSDTTIESKIHKKYC